MKKIISILFLMSFVTSQAMDIPLIDLTGPSSSRRQNSSPVVKESFMASDNAASSADSDTDTDSDTNTDSDTDADSSSTQDAATSSDIQLRTAMKKEEKPMSQRVVLPPQPQLPQVQTQMQTYNRPANPTTNQTASTATTANTNPQQYAAPQGRRLRLFLRELTILQQSAKKAGGDIRVTIEPVGVTPEELIGPLASANWFDIQYGKDAIVVKSKEEDPYVNKMREEVANLEAQRKALLSDVQSLERLASQWQSRVQTYQTSAANQDQQNAQQQQNSMQMSYQKTGMVQQPTYQQQQQQPMYPQQQQMTYQQQPQAYQTAPKTVVVNPQFAQQMMQGYNNQQVVVPQQRQQQMYPQQQMAEQQVPRTQMPIGRDLPASVPVSANAYNNEEYSPNGAALARHYLAQQGQTQMYQQPAINGDSQPQYLPPRQQQQSSSDSTVVLAPRAK